MKADGFRWTALVLALLTLGAACSDRGTDPGAPPSAAPSGPWQRTEDRAGCASFDPLRQPLFGDLHVHTRFSADASIFGTKVGPRDAYAFAQGASIALSDVDEQPTRSARLERPLDFAAVTDHAEFFGEVNLCLTPGSPLYDDEMCANLRKADDPGDRFMVTVQWLYPAGIPNPPKSHAFCSTPGVDCDAEAVSVWQEMQAAAEESYDRSEACAFTSFIGYESTASPLGRHQHRNVIFRNHVVPGFAASQLETAAEGTPQGVWAAVERDCLDAGTGCDALVIPHNANLSGGQQFEDPLDAVDARRRQDREPLVEIFQLKGNSECRFDRAVGRGVGTEDELCAFEQLARPHEGPDAPPTTPVEEWPRRNVVRNTLVDGLTLEQAIGVNPFRMGFVGGTDTHDATAGNVEEKGHEGSQGNGDASPSRMIANELRNNPGGLTAVWAEENSRDAIFAALARRETYATSGTRPVVRLFAGALPDDATCDAADLVARAYATATPMGGELGDVRGGASPRFAVLAVKDPGTAESPGADLQRVQIVKGWTDASGAPHERVYDVAGSASAASVDRATCAPPAGASELCAVWEDPEFEPAQRAVYYARVLEVPTCRWSTFTCKAAGVDPFASDCAAQAAFAGEAFTDCCSTQDDGIIEPVIQERAWTSPVWYRPESIMRVAGALDQRRGALELDVAIGRVPADVASGEAELTVVVSSAGELYRTTFAAGEAPLELDDAGGGVLHLRARGVDLAALAGGDATVRVLLESGLFRAEHVRRWRASRDTLAPVAG